MYQYDVLDILRKSEKIEILIEKTNTLRMYVIHLG